jgi:hypothetical protein
MATSAALADAGMPIADCVTACHIGLLKPELNKPETSREKSREQTQKNQKNQIIHSLRQKSADPRHKNVENVAIQNDNVSKTKPFEGKVLLDVTPFEVNEQLATVPPVVYGELVVSKKMCASDGRLLEKNSNGQGPNSSTITDTTARNTITNNTSSTSGEKALIVLAHETTQRLGRLVIQGLRDRCSLLEAKLVGKA